MDRRLVTVNLDDRDAGLMVDIGESGLAVQALARIKQGATTALQFELPDTSTRIEATGTVAWVDIDTGRAGIHFESLADASAASLKEWLGVSAATSQSPALAGAAAAAAVTPQPEIAPAPAPAAGVEVAAPVTPPRLGAESKVAEIAALQREITSQDLDRDAALALTAERARSLTRADGVAILLGNTDRMTCQASSGAAPPVGAELRPDSGLSGECVRTGVTARCEDTELDPRVDHEACRALNLRSAVVVPLFSRGNISGLVEVFYAAARGFEGRDVLTLRRIADLISATLCAPASREANPTPTAQAPSPLLPPAPASGLMIPPAPRFVPASSLVVCAVCGHHNPATASDCENCNFPLQAEWSHVATAKAGRWLRVRLKVGPRLLVLIVLLLLLLGLWGLEEYKSRPARTPAPARPTSAIDGTPRQLLAVGSTTNSPA
jgi:putative methionine-R-sulfoxide reductase with GAF domain